MTKGLAFLKVSELLSSVLGEKKSEKRKQEGEEHGKKNLQFARVNRLSVSQSGFTYVF